MEYKLWSKMGAFRLEQKKNTLKHPTSLVPGVTRCYQYWYRTPGVWSECGTNFNLSNSVVITWLP